MMQPPLPANSHYILTSSQPLDSYLQLRNLSTTMGVKDMFKLLVVKEDTEHKGGTDSQRRLS